MHFLYNIKVHACPSPCSSPLSDEGEELSTNHQISYLHGGPFLLVSALHTSSIIAYNLILNRQMTLWDIQREGETERKEGGERESEQNEHSMVLITSTCLAQETSAGTMRWITNRRSVFVPLDDYITIWYKNNTQSVLRHEFKADSVRFSCVKG